MRFLFFLIVINFDAIFIFGVPLYLIFFPFINNSFTSFFKAYSTDTSIRKIVNIVVFYSFLILIIDLFNGGSANSLAQVLLLNLLVLFIGVELYVYTKNDRKGEGMYMLLIIFLINALVAILQNLEIAPFWELPELINLYFGVNISNSKYYEIDFNQLNRVRGLFLFVHKFAPAIMAVSVLFFWHSYIYKKRNYLFFITATLTLAASFLTLTRSIFIGLLLGILIITLLYYKKSVLKISFGLIAFLFLFQIILGEDTSNNFSDRFNQTSSSAISDNDDYRIKGIENSFNRFVKNPLFGASKNKLDKITVHSVPIEILGSYGLVGFLTYLLFCYTFAKEFLKKNKLKFNILFIILFSIFLVDLLSHSSGFMFYDIFQFNLLMMLFGYSCNKNYNND